MSVVAAGTIFQNSLLLCVHGWGVYTNITDVIGFERLRG
jgi:hypothetical protein